MNEPEKKEEKREDVLNIRQNVELSEIKDGVETEEIPKLFKKLSLTDDQKQEIITGVKKGLDAIIVERNDLGLDDEWSSFEKQYWGIVKETEGATGSFAVHVHLTMKHCNMVENRCYQSFFESDPIFAVSPRPGLKKGEVKQAFETCQKKEDLLDYEFDTEMQVKSPIGQVIHSAVLLDGGILKLPWVMENEWIHDEEEYEGEKGLEEFSKNYNEEEYPQFVRRLKKGETIRLKVRYEVPVYSAPKPSFVELKNFYVPIKTKGLAGLRWAPLIAEKQSYTWQELKAAEKSGKFENVDDLKYIIDGKGNTALKGDYLSKDYTIWECIYRYALKEDGEEEKIVVWIDDESQKILGAISYPYWHNRPYYIPFFVSNRGIPGCLGGFYNSGLGRVLQPTNIIANAVSKFTLDAAQISNTLIFKVKEGSSIARQMLARRWYLGMPLEYENDKNEIDKVDTRITGINDLITLGALNQRMADDISGVSSAYMSGKADPTDPDAPASKTMALIKESNINVKHYIGALLNPMNELAYQALQLFYQFRKDLSFQLKKSRITGGKSVFDNMSRQELRLRTNITANAYSFAFDKLTEKRENLALVQFLTANPVLREVWVKNPEAVWALGNILIKGWSNTWNQKSEMIWPTEKEHEKKLVEIQKKAINEIFKEKVAQAQARMSGMPSQGAGMGANMPQGAVPPANGGMVQVGL